MKNPADLTEVCETILAYSENGDPIKDVIEQSAYSVDELIHELALFYVAENSTVDVSAVTERNDG
jgi:hypothetical protein